MTVYEFITTLRAALDRAGTLSLPNREVIVSFVAPHGGFCGPTVRPKFLGYPTNVVSDAHGPTEARYGLTRIQIERILEAFDVTLPPESDWMLPA